MVVKKIFKISVKHEKRSRESLTRESITFDDENTDRLMMSHNDTLAIILHILDTDANGVLIYPGSSATIIQLRVVEEMQVKNTLRFI